MNSLNNIKLSHIFNDMNIHANLNAKNINVSGGIVCENLTSTSATVDEFKTESINNISIDNNITLIDNQKILRDGIPIEQQLQNHSEFIKYIMSLLGLNINSLYVNNIFDSRILYPLSQTPNDLLSFLGIRPPFQQTNMLDLNQCLINNSLIINSHLGVNPTHFSSRYASIISNLPVGFANIIDLLLQSGLNTKVSICSSDTETDSLFINDLSSLITTPTYYSTTSTRGVILARDMNNKVIPNKHILSPLSLVFTDQAGYLTTPIEIPHFPFIDLDPPVVLCICKQSQLIQSLT